MKSNLLFLTKKGKIIHSLEVDLSRHMYNHFEDEDEWCFRNCNDSLEPYFVSETLFDLLLNSFDSVLSYEEAYGDIMSTHLLDDGLFDEKSSLLSNDETIKKEDIFELLKNGLKRENSKEFYKKLEKHGAEESDYILSKDIIDTYRKYLKRELSEDEFTDYSYLLCHVLDYNKDYKDDDLNTIVMDISWLFDGLAFGSDLSYDEEYYRCAKFFCYIKSCQRRIEKRLFGKSAESNRINNRFIMYVFDFEWNANMYLIHDTKSGKFNFGFFYADDNYYLTEYNYEFLTREEFYSLLEKFIADEEGIVRDERLTPKMILS